MKRRAAGVLFLDFFCQGNRQRRRRSFWVEKA